MGLGRAHACSRPRDGCRERGVLRDGAQAAARPTSTTVWAVTTHAGAHLPRVRAGLEVAAQLFAEGLG